MQALLDKIHAHPRATLIVAGAGVFGVVTIVILAMVLSLQNTITNPVVTPEEEKLVLSEVIKNNPKDLINKDTGIQSPIPTPNQNPNTVVDNTPAQGNNGEVPVPVQPVAPNLNEYNYRVTVSTNTKGPIFDSCRPYYGGGGGYGYYADSSSTTTKNEYYEYFERYLTVFKSVNTEDNKLSAFNISKYGKAINNSVYYLEGNYAVENSYKPYSDFDNQKDTFSVSYPEGDSNDLIKYYFGSNVSIIGVETNSNGEKIYILQSSYPSYCDPSYDPYLVTNDVPPVQRTIINRYRVNGSTFAIEKVSKYLDEVKDSNLLEVSTTQTSRAKVNASQVESQFKLKNNVTLVKNDYTNLSHDYNPYNDFSNKIDYLTTNGVSVLLPQNNDGLSYLSVTNYTNPDFVDTVSFFKDRLFFPNNTWGDTLFERYNKSYESNIEYSISLLENMHNYYTISAYNAETVLDSVVTEILATKSTSSSVSDATILVSGVPISAKKIVKVYTYSYPSSYPSSYSEMYNTNYYTYYVFEYNGIVYNINHYNNNMPMDFDLKEFVMYPLADDFTINIVKEKIYAMYTVYTLYWTPTSYPTSFPVSYSY